MWFLAERGGGCAVRVYVGDYGADEGEGDVGEVGVPGEEGDGGADGGEG